MDSAFSSQYALSIKEWERTEAASHIRITVSVSSSLNARLHAVQGLEDVAVLHTELEAQGAGFVLEGAAQGVAVDFHRQGDLEYQQGALFFLRHESLEVFDVYLLIRENLGERGDDFKTVFAVHRHDERFALGGTGRGGTGGNSRPVQLRAPQGRPDGRAA